MASSDGQETYYDNQFIRHCDKETLSPVTGTVKGNIPSWLRGELTAVGPGIQKVGNDHYNHIFDGLAVLHKFRIHDGQAYYQSRALQSDAYKRNMEANRIVVSEFGTRALPDPCQTIFGRLKADFQWLGTVLKKGYAAVMDDEISDNCSVNVGYYGDQLYAMTETNHLRRIDPSSLETIGEKTTLGNYVAMNSASAHPHVMKDGTVINVGNNYRHSKGPHYCFMKVPPMFNSEVTNFSNAEIIAEIPSRWKFYPAYFHSFGITSTGKLIFIEYPFQMNLMGVVVGNWFTKRSYSDWIKWCPDKKTRFYVVSINDGKIHPVVYETDKLFLFHHINAFEANGQIIVDVVGYDDAEWVTRYGTASTKDTKVELGKFGVKANSTARRYILPLNVEGTTPGEDLIKQKSETSATAILRDVNGVVDLTPHFFTNCESMLELPRINYRFNGKPYRYFYGLGNSQPAQTFDVIMNKIIKVDTLSDQNVSWLAEESVRVLEPVFVPAPMTNGQDQDEDDGVVLVILLKIHIPRDVSLIILDAKYMKEIARINFIATGTVTGALHGQWAQEGEKVHVY